MDDIKDKLVDVLRTDTVLQTLLGGTPTDPRIVPYYTGTAQVSREKPAYITYAATAQPEATLAVESTILNLMIWIGAAHGSWTRAEQITTRIRELFHKQVHITRDARKLYSKFVNVNDSTQHQPNFVGRSIQIRFSFSTV